MLNLERAHERRIDRIAKGVHVATQTGDDVVAKADPLPTSTRRVTRFRRALGDTPRDAAPKRMPDHRPRPSRRVRRGAQSRHWRNRRCCNPRSDDPSRRGRADQARSRASVGGISGSTELNENHESLYP